MQACARLAREQARLCDHPPKPLPLLSILTRQHKLQECTAAATRCGSCAPHLIVSSLGIWKSSSSSSRAAAAAATASTAAAGLRAASAAPAGAPLLLPASGRGGGGSSASSTLAWRAQAQPLVR